MLHSFVKIWIHIVWSTKKRTRLILPEKAIIIRENILEYAKENEILLESINIQPEHVHALILLPSDKMVKDIVKSIKGESSHYINASKLFQQPFSWQRGYGAFSIGASQVETVKNYIRNQEKHHQKRSFRDEWNLLLEKYGLKEYVE